MKRKMKMKKNKIKALVLAAALLASAATTVLAADEAQSEVIEIESADDLIALAALCRLDTWSVGKTVVLRADISLEGTAFGSIPSFAGEFDGNGHTISGFAPTDTLTPAGLFGTLQQTGTVKNLTLGGTVMPDGDAQTVGGLVGENYGTVINCVFTGQVVGAANTGGLVGLNAASGTVVGCTARGTVCGSDKTGGIVGCNLGSVFSCVNEANINTVGVDPTIDPEKLSLDFLTDVSKLKSMDVSSAAMDTGGIAGYSTGFLKDCANRAAVGYPHIGYNVGGVVGRSCGYVAACTNSAEINGRKDVGGIAGQTEPYLEKDLSESELVKLERQLDELDALLDTALRHAEGASAALTARLNGIASCVSDAAEATRDIRTSGTIESTVTGSAAGRADGSATVTPLEGALGGGIQAGGGSASLGGIEAGDGSLIVGNAHGGEGTLSAGVGGSLSGSAAGEGSALLGAELDALTQIDISTDLAGLSSSLYGMAGQMSMLGDELNGASEELSNDAIKIKAKINEITEGGFALLTGSEGTRLTDTSDSADLEQITLGKVYACASGGEVRGDLNVGGVVGAMGIEYSLDPEDDLNVDIDRTTKRSYELRAVVQQCENTGTVCAKRNYVGGIAGKMDLGLVAQCESYGSVSSESGSYVGGVAGLCGATIRHCFVKCSLSGGKYVGGVVGSGVEETKSGTSSTVAGCCVMAEITDGEQYIGAISGAYAGVFLENYFVSSVSEDVAGINGRSYTGCAQPLTYAELLARFEQTDESETVAALPDAFQSFFLRFVADGETLRAETFSYGDSFSDDVFPDLPQKEGFYAHWNRTELGALHFDTTVTAVYEPYLSALAGGGTRDGERPIFLVEGDFGETDALAASAMALTPDALPLPSGIWDAVKKSLCEGKLSTRVVEQWQLTLPEGGAHTFRYLPPNGDAEHMEVYVLRNGTWRESETEVIGSYVSFRTGGSEVQLAVVHSQNMWWARLIVAALLLAAAWLIVRLTFAACKRVRRKREKK